jgi:DNA primase catalytic core
MSRYDLEEVLRVADLPEVAQRLGLSIEKRGANLVAKCPFHQDTRPSLVLYPNTSDSRSHYHCFSCNAHGYAIDLVKEVRGDDFKRAIDWLANSFGVAPQRGATGKRAAIDSTREDAFDFAQRVFDERHNEEGFATWCQERRFKRDFLYALGLRYLPPGSPLVQTLEEEKFGRRQELIDGLLSAGLLFRLRPDIKPGPQRSLDLHEQFRDYFHDGRVLIPIRSDKDHLIGFAGRYRPQLGDAWELPDVPKYLLTPGFSKAGVLFNSYGARQTIKADAQAGERRPALYIVEGFLDALRLQALSLPAVAVMGSSLGEKQREELIKLTEAANLPDGTHLKLRLFLDRDTAGFDGTRRITRQLLGLPAVEIEWVGFGTHDRSPAGKDPDEILAPLDEIEARVALDERAIPAVGVLTAAALGYKDATPLVNDENWNGVSRYLRERGLLQTFRAIHALSGATANWVQRLKDGTKADQQWVKDLVVLLEARHSDGRGERRPSGLELSFLQQREARLNHARLLAEHGSRRGELPCDDETWRALDRNAQLFNSLALDRLKQPTWRQAAPCDAVHLPRKLSSDEKVLADPRRKVMPHAADLHLQQFLMNELLTERRDFSHEGPLSFSDCIPSIRWFPTEGEARCTGYIEEGEPSPTPSNNDLSQHDEPILSFAYQIDMDVIEGRRKPTDQGMFRPFMQCWRAFMASLDRQAKAIGPQVHVMRLDVKRYYDSIQRYVVRDRLGRQIEKALEISGAEDIAELLNLEGSDSQAVAQRLVDLLCGGIFEYAYQNPDDGSRRASEEVRGIPQGPVISAWIGTIVMFPVDAAVREFMRQPDQRHRDDSTRPRVGYARYVDDIVLMADSEARLNALREIIHAAASHLDLTLVRKGETVAPGSPESIMRQLNEGRALAPSVPVWEPPIVGDGEPGWGMGEDEADSMDRQSALHLLQHPSLLDDATTVHRKIGEAMGAPDLRPGDLGKCARALWWQAAVQVIDRSTSTDDLKWENFWREYCRRWDEASAGHAWVPAFKHAGNDVLFAVEGLDMLMDSGLSMEKGRTQEWIHIHRKALDALAKSTPEMSAWLRSTELLHNRAHIQSRVRKVQWKAMKRVPEARSDLHVESQRSDSPTLTDWLCLAAILLNRYDNQSHSGPLDKLAARNGAQDASGPREVENACNYLKRLKAPSTVESISLDQEASRIALQFLVANTGFNRWHVLSQYSWLLGQHSASPEKLTVLPPLPIEDAGMLAYTGEGTNIRFVAFSPSENTELPGSMFGATMVDGDAQPVPPLRVVWPPSEEIVRGLYRAGSSDTFDLSFDDLDPMSRTRFAAALFEVLHAIQCQDGGEGKERIIVMPHIAHSPIDGAIKDAADCSWYLVSRPVNSSHLGVSAWVRDGREGLRSVSVPSSGEYTRLWRLGCAVSDALGIAFDVQSEATALSDFDSDLLDPQQIEDYLLRQQLSKLRGSWISEAQVSDEGDAKFPRTIERTLDILRRFDSSLEPAEQVKLVLLTEAETRSMAMRLERQGPSDLRSRLHQLPGKALQRLPLSVLEWMPLPDADELAALRTDTALLLAVARIWNADNLSVDTAVSNDTRISGPAQALHIAFVLAATGEMLRGLVASIWGVARFRRDSVESLRLSIPENWNAPDNSLEDPQQEYSVLRKRLRDDNWSDLKEASPWSWMLLLLGVLNDIAPQVLQGDNPLLEVYEYLRRWKYAAPDENRQWSWPYDDLPPYEAMAWSGLLAILPIAARHVDDQLGFSVKQIKAPVFRRRRDDHVFTDAASEQWTLSNVQFTGIGSNDSVARVTEGSRRLATWTEVRRQVNNELLSVHTLDDKLGKWWYPRNNLAAFLSEHADTGDGVDKSIVVSDSPTADSVAHLPRHHVDVGTEGSSFAAENANDRAIPSGSSTTNSSKEVNRNEFRRLQIGSWKDRGSRKPPSHMRVALLQWRIDESYSHPVAEVGVRGMGLPEWAQDKLRGALDPDSTLAKADGAAVRGKEHTWPHLYPVSAPSWPEHRRRKILTRALEACSALAVELLVLPEVSVRRETVDWLQEELDRNYPGLAVLAGTYRHFGRTVHDWNEPTAPPGKDIHHLMAPLTLLWRPSDELAENLLLDATKLSRTLRFYRGKKYRAVAANELFRPDWDSLQPLFRLTPLLEQLGELDLPTHRQLAFFTAISERMPSLQYCMELVCSELFLLTSPANLVPLQNELAALMKRFPSEAGEAEEQVREDFKQLGSALSVLQPPSINRRTILLVPAATARSNDYWHAGQASVLASGTATVFCNAAKSDIACGGSCFIGIDSATKPNNGHVGIIETLTPYHGWRKGILTARADGALHETDQALVVADIDPVHVVSGRPRPQLLPEPIALIAYLPVVELLDPDTTKDNLHRALANYGDQPFSTSSNSHAVRDALSQIATAPNFCKKPDVLWSHLGDLLDGGLTLDGERLERFAKLFPDPKAIRERLRAWERDRHQQPNRGHGALEPAWVDFLEVDLTLREDKPLPFITVPPWSDDLDIK